MALVLALLASGLGAARGGGDKDASTSAAKGRGSEGAPATKRAVAACRADADCIVVPDGCCGCHEGGKQKAIRARDKAAHDRGQRAGCRETMCAAMISNDPSCQARAHCKEGTCTLAP